MGSLPVHAIVFGFGFCAGGLMVCWLWHRDVERVRNEARDAVAKAKAQSAAHALNEMYRPKRRVRDGRLITTPAFTEEEAWDNLMGR